MTEYYRCRGRAPASCAIYVQESGHWGIRDGVHAPVWTAGTIPDTVMSTLEEISEKDAVSQLSTNYQLRWPTQQALKRRRWRAVIGYLLGWIVGVAGLFVLMAASWLGEHGVASGSVPRSGSVALLLVTWILVLGLVAAGIGMAFTWSSSGWNRLKPGELVLRLTARTLSCSGAIIVSYFLLFVALLFCEFLAHPFVGQ